MEGRANYLPRELLLIIFGRFKENHDVLNCKLVSKNWLNVCYDARLTWVNAGYLIYSHGREQWSVLGMPSPQGINSFLWTLSRRNIEELEYKYIMLENQTSSDKSENVDQLYLVKCNLTFFYEEFYEKQLFDSFLWMLLRNHFVNRLISYRKSEYDESMLHIPNQNVPRIDDIPEISLTLRDYQLDAISWMRWMESRSKEVEILSLIPWIGSSCQYAFDLEKSFIYKWEDTEPNIKCKINRAVLRDESGMGKSVDILGLILSHRYQSTQDLQYTNNQLNTKATLIICQPMLISQWYEEIVRSSKVQMKVITIFSMKQFTPLTIKDFLDADVVLVSINFFANSSYRRLSCPLFEGEKNNGKNQRKRNIKYLFQRLRASKIDLLEEKNPLFEYFNWWRIVRDGSTYSSFTNHYLSGNFIWDIPASAYLDINYKEYLDILENKSSEFRHAVKPTNDPIYELEIENSVLIYEGIVLDEYVRNNLIWQNRKSNVTDLFHAPKHDLLVTDLHFHPLEYLILHFFKDSYVYSWYSHQGNLYRSLTNLIARLPRLANWYRRQLDFDPKSTLFILQQINEKYQTGRLERLNYKKPTHESMIIEFGSIRTHLYEFIFENLDDENFKIVLIGDFNPQQMRKLKIDVGVCGNNGPLANKALEDFASGKKSVLILENIYQFKGLYLETSHVFFSLNMLDYESDYEKYVTSFKPLIEGTPVTVLRYNKENPLEEDKIWLIDDLPDLESSTSDEYQHHHHHHHHHMPYYYDSSDSDDNIGFPPGMGDFNMFLLHQLLGGPGLYFGDEYSDSF